MASSSGSSGGSGGSSSGSGGRMCPAGYPAMTCLTAGSSNGVGSSSGWWHPAKMRSMAGSGSSSGSSSAAHIPYSALGFLSQL